MRITLLGTGGPRPDPARQGPATLVQVAGLRLLFDAGRGIGRDLTDEQIEQELDHEIWNFDYPTLRPI
jgi:ribonuclease BN (tRNA processing enzyme)